MVFTDQYAFCVFNQRDLRAQTGQGLCQFTTHRTTAQNRDAFGNRGKLFELVPQRVAGGKADVLEPGNVWNDRLRAGGDHDAAACEARWCLAGAGNFNRPRVENLGVAVAHIDPHGAITLWAVVRRDRCNHCADAAQHSRPVHFHGAYPYPIRLCHSGKVRHLGALNQGFAGYATHIQTIPAHGLGLDQSDFRLGAGCDQGADQAACAGTNHHHVAIKSRGALSTPRAQCAPLADFF